MNLNAQVLSAVYQAPEDLKSGEMFELLGALQRDLNRAGVLCHVSYRMRARAKNEPMSLNVQVHVIGDYKMDLVKTVAQSVAPRGCPVTVAVALDQEDKGPMTVVATVQPALVATLN